MDKDTIYALAKVSIALIVTVTAAILAMTNGNNAEVFKVIAAAVIGYMFAQNSDKKD